MFMPWLCSFPFPNVDNWLLCTPCLKMYPSTHPVQPNPIIPIPAPRNDQSRFFSNKCIPICPIPLLSTRFYHIQIISPSSHILNPPPTNDLPFQNLHLPTLGGPSALQHPPLPLNRVVLFHIRDTIRASAMVMFSPSGLRKWRVLFISISVGGGRGRYDTDG